MTLTHYSTDPVQLIKSSSQNREFSHKPRGFWVSDDDDYGWAQWADEAEWARGKLKHEVKLSKNANILYLHSPADLDRFTAEYTRTDPPWDNVEFLRPIAWHDVAKKYDGIIITPYQWSKRLDINTHWYYTWDCASGCIWNKEAVAEITLVNA